MKQLTCEKCQNGTTLCYGNPDYKIFCLTHFENEISKWRSCYICCQFFDPQDMQGCVKENCQSAICQECFENPLFNEIYHLDENDGIICHKHQ